VALFRFARLRSVSWHLVLGEIPTDINRLVVLPLGVEHILLERGGNSAVVKLVARGLKDALLDGFVGEVDLLDLRQLLPLEPVDHVGVHDVFQESGFAHLSGDIKLELGCGSRLFRYKILVEDGVLEELLKAALRSLLPLDREAVMLEVGDEGLNGVPALEPPVVHRPELVVGVLL